MTPKERQAAARAAEAEKARAEDARRAEQGRAAEAARTAEITETVERERIAAEEAARASTPSPGIAAPSGTEENRATDAAAVVAGERQRLTDEARAAEERAAAARVAEAEADAARSAAGTKPHRVALVTGAAGAVGETVFGETHVVRSTAEEAVDPVAVRTIGPAAPGLFSAEGAFGPAGEAAGADPRLSAIAREAAVMAAEMVRRQAAAPAALDAGAADAFDLRITAKRDGFRRAGLAHPGVPTLRRSRDFTPEQVAALKLEPMLFVETIKAA